MSKTLKAYMVWRGEDPVECGAALVFAHTAREAKNFAWDCGIWDSCFIETQTQRMPHCDRLLRAGTISPYIEMDDAMLREAGWRCEGDVACVQCGLYDLDGKHPLCDECDQCADCGHDPECPKAGVSQCATSKST